MKWSQKGNRLNHTKMQYLQGKGAKRESKGFKKMHFY